MNRGITFCLALALSCVLSGCASPRIPAMPTADQVSSWAGFPGAFLLQTESVTNLGAEPSFGKLIWGAEYKNPARSPVSLSISVFQPGTLWGTNRAAMPASIEKQIARMQQMKTRDDFLKNAFQIIALPHGRKAYFTVLGFGPGGIGLAGFSYGPDYDLMVTEDVDAEDGPPDVNRIKDPVSPTNDLPVVFGKVATFLGTQKK
jgi:hypothetical protein